MNRKQLWPLLPAILMATILVLLTNSSGGTADTLKVDTSINRTASDIAPHAYLPYMTHGYCVDFYDDFSDPTSGWAVGENKRVAYGYHDGEYRVDMKNDGYIFSFMAPTCPRLYYIIDVQARWVGDTGNSLGIVFNIVGDFEEYYLFDINTKVQMFRLFKRSQDGWEEIIPPTVNLYINRNDAPNLLRVIRFKATPNNELLELSVNYVPLQSIYGQFLDSPGGAGVVASPVKGIVPREARFDNFVMKWHPSRYRSENDSVSESSNRTLQGDNFLAIPDLPPWPAAQASER